jgi:hypothetical protein
MMVFVVLKIGRLYIRTGTSRLNISTLSLSTSRRRGFSAAYFVFWWVSTASLFLDWSTRFLASLFCVSLGWVHSQHNIYSLFRLLLYVETLVASWHAYYLHFFCWTGLDRVSPLRTIYLFSVRRIASYTYACVFSTNILDDGRDTVYSATARHD